MGERIQDNYPIAILDKDTASKHAERLGELANQIPQVEYTAEDILAETKGERELLRKWDHSLIVFDGDKTVGFIMGYERKGEGNDQYPDNTIYISELAVDESYQRRGIARQLLESFLEKNNHVGLLSLDGDTNYSIQTNSAGWNSHVIELYESFGFKKRATKDYPNRTDVILGYTP